jgi:glycyl-tRNA synthetase
MKKPELTEVAREIYDRLQDETEFLVDYDETGNIGKRYRRQDEIGTPFCFTVDPDSLTDGKVTVRDRDTTTQERIAIDDVVSYVSARVR